MESLLFVQHFEKFELEITVCKFQTGIKNSKTVGECTFIYQEMIDEEGKLFYFLDTCAIGKWTGAELPLVQHFNHFFNLDLTECIVKEKTTSQRYRMAVAKKEIKLPDFLEYRDQDPGIYSKKSFEYRDFDDPVCLDSEGNLLPARLDSKVTYNQEPDYLVF
jgi:hypothetical protein